jgi:uncharacterized protein
MILYLDSSALVKKYVWETGSEEIVSSFAAAEQRAISCVGYAEVLAALHRRLREGTLSAAEVRKAKGEMKADWSEMITVDVTDQLNDLAEKLAAKHALRGFDLIHLSSVLLLMGQLRSEDLRFACADIRLLGAARKEGIETVPQLL